MFIGGASEATAKVAKQARELGFKGGFIVMDQAKFDQMKAITGSYDTFNNSIGVTPLIYSDFPGTDGFVEKYHDKYDGVDPSSESGLDYIALYALVGAMEAAGTVDDVEKIRSHVQDGLDSIPDEKKVYNIPSVTKEGSFEIDRRLTIIEDGEVKEYEE
jgi:branched-chain amino acid transport system substrate-binding protein